MARADEASPAIMSLPRITVAAALRVAPSGRETATLATPVTKPAQYFVKLA